MMLIGGGANVARVSTTSKTPPTIFVASIEPSSFSAVKNFDNALVPEAAALDAFATLPGLPYFLTPALTFLMPLLKAAFLLPIFFAAVSFL